MPSACGSKIDFSLCWLLYLITRTILKWHSQGTFVALFDERSFYCFCWFLFAGISDLGLWMYRGRWMDDYKLLLAWSWRLRYRRLDSNLAEKATAILKPLVGTGTTDEVCSNELPGQTAGQKAGSVFCRWKFVKFYQSCWLYLAFCIFSPNNSNFHCWTVPLSLTWDTLDFCPYAMISPCFFSFSSFPLWIPWCVYVNLC